MIKDDNEISHLNHSITEAACYFSFSSLFILLHTPNRPFFHLKTMSVVSSIRRCVYSHNTNVMYNKEYLQSEKIQRTNISDLNSIKYNR